MSLMSRDERNVGLGFVHVLCKTVDREGFCAEKLKCSNANKSY